MAKKDNKPAVAGKPNTVKSKIKRSSDEKFLVTPSGLNWGTEEEAKEWSTALCNNIVTRLKIFHPNETFEVITPDSETKKEEGK